MTKKPKQKQKQYCSKFDEDFKNSPHQENIIKKLQENIGKDFNMSESVKQVLSSVQFSRSIVSNYLRPHASQHARPPYTSPTPGVYSNSCPSCR